MKFTIKRDKWLRGDMGNRDTALYAPGNDRSCCLGHVFSQATGISRSQLVGCAVIESATRLLCKTKEVNDLTNLGFIEEYDRDVLDSEFSASAMSINDNEFIEDWQREEELKNLFESQGHELEFV